MSVWDPYLSLPFAEQKLCTQYLSLHYLGWAPSVMNGTREKKFTLSIDHKGLPIISDGFNDSAFLFSRGSRNEDEKKQRNGNRKHAT